MKISEENLRLILLHISGEGSTDEERQMQDWLVQHPQNQEEFEKIKRVWETSGQIGATPIDVDAEWAKFRAKHFNEQKAEPRVIRFPFGRTAIFVAAAAAVLIGLFVGVRYFASPETYSTGAGQRLLVSLEDGTEVVLGESSVLQVSRNFNKEKREVELQGEGFFTVAKNPHKVFEITGPQTGIRVLGTEFHLTADKAKNAVGVAEGKVAYWTFNLADTLILTKGEEGVVAQNKLTGRKTSSPNFDSWKTGSFIFENEPVAEVLESLQDRYVFNVANSQKLENSGCRFSGKFKNQPLEEVLSELALVMGLEYGWKESTLTVKKLGCE